LKTQNFVTKDPPHKDGPQEIFIIILLWRNSRTRA
jgi:hypothetical protein